VSFVWKPRVRTYKGQYGDCDLYYIAFIYKGKIERRVNCNTKMIYYSAWNEAWSAAIKMNELESQSHA
jgi:hypothetical protein